MLRRRRVLLARQLAVAVLVQRAEVLIVRRTRRLLFGYETVLVLVQAHKHLLGARHRRARTRRTRPAGAGRARRCRGRPGARRARSGRRTAAGASARRCSAGACRRGRRRAARASARSLIGRLGQDWQAKRSCDCYRNESLHGVHSVSFTRVEKLAGTCALYNPSSPDVIPESERMLATNMSAAGDGRVAPREGCAPTIEWPYFHSKFWTGKESRAALAAGTPSWRGG